MSSEIITRNLIYRGYNTEHEGGATVDQRHDHSALALTAQHGGSASLICLLDLPDGQFCPVCSQARRFSCVPGKRSLMVTSHCTQSYQLLGSRRGLHHVAGPLYKRQSRLGKQQCLHVQAVSESSQQQQQQQQRQLYMGAASLAAVTLLAGLWGWHSASRGRQQQQQQQGGFSSSRGQRSGGHHGSSSSFGTWGLHELKLPGGWLLIRSRSTDEEWEAIESQHHAEAQQALQLWDERFQLRNRSLPELRSLAQRHNIAGRSKMRKRELVEALEQALGHSSEQP